MKFSDDEKRKLVERILISRMRILSKHGFYGLLLMNVKFGLDDSSPTAYTDGDVIRFNSEFLFGLTNDELDFILMHEIMHVALRHCFRGKNYNPELFNIACDIVVNSNILKSNNMNLNSISYKNEPSMHLAPDNKEGYLYTAEEVYEMLLKSIKNKSNNLSGSLDDHSKWKEDSSKMDEWMQKIVNASKANISKDKNAGNLPVGIIRDLDELEKGSLNWRNMLNDFLSFEVADYSFTPPDRRYDNGIFLPDFNELEENVFDVSFFVDTSGSITKEELTSIYSEIGGFLDQFNHVNGKISFFDCNVYGPYDFADIDELSLIKPKGGGGTSFDIIFKTIDKSNPPKAIVIFTDGYASFPDEEAALNIPVLWIINNNKITPPWGMIGRM